MISDLPDDTTDRARRALMIACTTCFAFTFFHQGIDKINILGTQISTGQDHYKVWAVLLIWIIWVGWRYVQLKGFAELSGSNTFFSLKERYAINSTIKIAKRVIHSRCLSDASSISGISEEQLAALHPTIRYTATGEADLFSLLEQLDGFSPSERAETKRGLEQYHRQHLTFVAHIQYTVSYQSQQGTRNIRGTVAEDMAPPKWILVKATLQAVIGLCLFDRWSTEKILPIPFFIAALVISIYQLLDAFPS